MLSLARVRAAGQHQAVCRRAAAHLPGGLAAAAAGERGGAQRRQPARHAQRAANQHHGSGGGAATAAAAAAHVMRELASAARGALSPGEVLPCRAHERSIVSRVCPTAQVVAVPSVCTPQVARATKAKFMSESQRALQHQELQQQVCKGWPAVLCQAAAGDSPQSSSPLSPDRLPFVGAGPAAQAVHPRVAGALGGCAHAHARVRARPGQ